ncbi:hypothetical protein [Clostridium culturomicium]|uniref:hypothetical protein n=1 Tax=Clostridium culturomicium TaxID=1499683 RepID=UPI00058F52DD|nr:hypothetical protein [Clostridium culturomicium]
MVNVIDAFGEFKNILEKNLNKSTEDKLQLWIKYYEKNYPELKEKCTCDYEKDGYSWKEVAVNKVFNRVAEDFCFMIEAHENLLKVLKDIEERVIKVFHVEIDINIVLYSSLGHAAGWVDEYEGKRAIIFGIDKIAELRWQTTDQLDSLVCHELSHVVHYYIRNEVIPKWAEENKYNNGIWNIYEEGFAQFFQHKLSYAKVDSRGEGWISICNENKDKLKKLYLEALKNDERGTNDFFGDWFQVLGISDAGYFLGAELIKGLSEKYDLKHIACMKKEDIEKVVLDFLN